MSTAMQRAMQRRRRARRRGLVGRGAAVLCIIAVPFAIWLMAWPYNLLAAVPLSVAGLYLGLIMRY